MDNRDIKLGCKKRLAWLDSLRAMAVLLVVLGHVLDEMEMGKELFGAIYRFHMPLFFMMSGITHELSWVGNIKEINRRTVKRCVNIFVPATVFTIISYLLFPENDIFFYYNTAWFLWHLLFISLAAAFEDACSFQKQNKLVWFLLWVYVLLWLVYGVMQLALMQLEGVVYYKFAKEISKFFGYLLCFRAGRWLIRHQETALKTNERFYWLLIAAIMINILGIVFRVDPDIALVRISFGILSSWVIVVIYYHLRKRCFFLEQVMSKFSLEIYLIHVMLIRMMNTASFSKGSFTEQIFFSIIELIIYLGVPILVAYCEKYVPPLRYLFHPTQ